MSNGIGGYSFDKLVDSICVRPRCYVCTGTFLEVATFLEAFAMGLAAGNPDLGKVWAETGWGPPMVSEWVDFSRDWLWQKLDYPRNFVWLSVLRERYPDDQTAIEQLRLLYLEFKAEKDSQKEA